jgi:hypothetical protein
MEDKGPNDLCHHDSEMFDTIMELDPEISILSAQVLGKTITPSGSNRHR